MFFRYRSTISTIQTREENGEKRRVTFVSSKPAVDRILSDLRNAATDTEQLPNILPKTFQDTTKKSQGRYLRSLRAHDKRNRDPASLSPFNARAGIVLSWRPETDPVKLMSYSNPRGYLEIWDGTQSVYEPISTIPLYSELTGLYPKNVGPTTRQGGQVGTPFGFLDTKRKGCKVYENSDC